GSRTPRALRVAGFRSRREGGAAEVLHCDVSLVDGKGRRRLERGRRAQGGGQLFRGRALRGAAGPAVLLGPPGSLRVLRRSDEARAANEDDLASPRFPRR